MPILLHSLCTLVIFDNNKKATLSFVISTHDIIKLCQRIIVFFLFSNYIVLPLSECNKMSSVEYEELESISKYKAKNDLQN